MTECTVCHMAEATCRDRYGRPLCKACMEYESQYFDLKPLPDADSRSGFK